MTVIRATWLVGAFGAAALAALLPGATASGNGSPVIGGGGVLELHLGNDADYVKFLPPTGSSQASAVQPILSKKCVATLGSPPLVSLTPQPSPPTGAVGLFDHGLGVKVAGEGTGTPCGRVDGLSQALSLSLAGSLAGKLFSFAELDIEGKFAVTVLARAYEGTTLVGTAQLPTGPSSDSGPDSNDGDNFRWLIQPSLPFDQLVLSVDPSTPGGSFSLEGGADGTAPQPGGLGAALNTHDSVFQLADFTGVLDCGESSPTIGGGGTPTAELTRGQNASCQKIPYLLRTDKTGSAQSVLLQKLLGNQIGSNFTMTIVWEPEPKANPLPATTIDYDGPGPNQPTPVEWCDGTPSAPILPLGQKWCLTSHQAVIVGGGKVQLSEGYYGSGDPVWAR